MGVFINLSNHPSLNWSNDQLSEAKKYGKVIDIPFPSIDASCSEDVIDELVDEYYIKLNKYDNPVVMVQGEFTFTYRIVKRLKEAGIKALTSCSERIATTKTDADGNVEKMSVFKFVRFREY